MIVLEGVTADVCVQLPGDGVYEGVVIPQAVHVVSIDESNFKEGLPCFLVRRPDVRIFLVGKIR